MTVKSMAESPRLLDRKIRGGKEDRWLNRKLQTVGRETRLLGGLRARTKVIYRATDRWRSAKHVMI